MSISGFYRAFEDRHRGSRELIRARLEAYQPFIAPLLELYQPATAVDLGCGRGEWLELLHDNGFEPHGVDLDDGMLAACIELGLPVTQGDAIKYLASLAEDSQAIVSGFHIAEHISFEALDALVSHSLRALKPGGLLILETPNPENLVVGTCNFYLDPTHIRPIPPALLLFLPEYHGFCRARVVRLQEDKSLQEGKDIELINVLGGVSPDYAVVAQKAANTDVLTKFDAAFEAAHGIELQQLAKRYDQKTEGKVSELDGRLATAEAQALQLAQRMEQAEARADSAQASQHELQGQVDQLNGHVHQWWQRASQIEAERDALRHSWSWRITAPLRFGAGLLIHWGATLRNGTNHAIYRVVETCQRPLSWLMAAVLRRPKLRYRINQVLMRYPEFYQQLLGVARSGGVVPGSPHYVPPAGSAQQNLDPSLNPLTPRARQIYADLKDAIEQNKRTS